MTRSFAPAVLLLIAAGLLRAQSAQGVGDGAPDSATQVTFINAFFRNGFPNLVLLPPKDNVYRAGPGYVQDFAAATGLLPYALAKGDSTGQVYQMCCQIEQLHATLGGFAGTIGYPLSDPAFVFSAVDSSQGLQQSFVGNYVIIVYQTGAQPSQAFYIRGQYLTQWQLFPTLAFPVSQEHNTTSHFSTTATQQDFQGGVIVLMTSGLRQSQIFTVTGLIYAKYSSLGGTASYLGYPIGPEITVSGLQRQYFEGGYVDYTPGSTQPATAHAPVVSLVLDTTALNLQVGNVVQKKVVVMDNQGGVVTDMPVTWTTSNGAVIHISPASGFTVTLTAVGPGFANVTAVAGGVTSPPLRITVTSACCLAGQGAPSSQIGQAIQSALARNNIVPRLPTDNPVSRSGSGYVQQFAALSPSTLGSVLVTKSDAAALAYVVAGGRLTLFIQLGGVTGSLGFPASDANAAGRQMFENHAAMAGSPPLVVSSSILDKWASAGYETGAAGLPVSAPAATAWSPFGSIAIAQTFQGGVIYAFSAGPRAGQAFFVSGLTLARYQALGGPAGELGLPTSDAFPSEGLTRQNFEGGSIAFAPGDSAAAENLTPRSPAVTVFPAAATIGGRVHISISGFAPGHRLTISITGQPSFSVAVSNGAFGWDQQILSGQPAGVYRVTAIDPASGDQASGSYQVRSSVAASYQLTKISGDNQTALPGSQAQLPLVVQLTDGSGNSIAGAAVTFATLPGASVQPVSAVTDANGYAQTFFRLPPANGLMLATAQALGQVATFSALAQDARLTDFPSFQQSIDNITVGGGAFTIHEKGSLLTSVAALFRYYQDQGALPVPAGLADPAALNQFLSSSGYLSFRLNGRTEMVVNLLRSLGFVSDAADFQTAPIQLNSIRDSLNQKVPVLLGLMLRSANQNRGVHYVVATGVGSDGTILIYDPSPDWNRTVLSDYLNGFAALGQNWSASLLHALRLSLRPRTKQGFLVYGPGSASLQLASPGSVGYALRVPAEAAFDGSQADNGDTADLAYADGTASQFQLTTAASGVGVWGPAAAGPLGAGVFQIKSAPASLSVTPQALAVTSDGLRDAANFTTQLAPGSLASLFGSGLAAARSLPSGLPLPASLAGFQMTVGNLPAPLLYLDPFQVNLQIPFGLAPGQQEVQVTSPFGSASFSVTLAPAAPGIFLLNPSTAAVLNPDFSLNSPQQPAARGSYLQIFAAGLGAVFPAVTTGAAAPSSPLSYASAVTASLDGQPATVAFAGLAPGFAGLYQINIQVPPALAPDPVASLVVMASGQSSIPVTVAVQ